MTMSDSDSGAAALREVLGEDVSAEEWACVRARYERTNPGRLAWAGRVLAEHKALVSTRKVRDAADITEDLRTWPRTDVDDIAVKSV